MRAEPNDALPHMVLGMPSWKGTSRVSETLLSLESHAFNV